MHIDENGVKAFRISELAPMCLNRAPHCRLCRGKEYREVYLPVAGRAAMCGKYCVKCFPENARVE